MSKHYYKKIFSITLLSAFLVMFCSSALAIKNTTGIANGIHSGKVDLSGLDQQTAAKKLTDDFSANSENGILNLTYQNKVKTIKATDIDLRCDAQTTAQEAAQIGNGNNFFKDLFDKLICTYHGKNIPLTITYDQNKLAIILQQISKEINTAPVSAYIYPNGQAVTTVKGKIGKVVDKDNFSEIVAAAIEKQVYPQTLSVPINETEPMITTNTLKSIDTILSIYTTHFTAGDINRNTNIALAAKNLSGTLVLPGTIFSFNETVGPRLAAVGYRNAPVIVSGKVVPGIGGGVCQVSSTLYDAILLAGLTPVERTGHYSPVSYIPRAFDATVADGLIDFKFRNDFKHPIYIYTNTEKNTLSIYIMGSSDDKAIASSISLVNDTHKNGSVSAYRVYSNNGIVNKKEFLHTDKW